MCLHISAYALIMHMYAYIMQPAIYVWNTREGRNSIHRREKEGGVDNGRSWRKEATGGGVRIGEWRENWEVARYGRSGESG